MDTFTCPFTEFLRLNRTPQPFISREPKADEARSNKKGAQQLRLSLDVNASFTDSAQPNDKTSYNSETVKENDTETFEFTCAFTGHPS